MENSHERLAAWLGVKVDEIHFGPSTSQNTYVLANAFRSMWRGGDEIVASTQGPRGQCRGVGGGWRRRGSR